MGMSYTRTKIANIALGFVEAPALTSLDSSEVAAAVELRAVWDVALDEALAMYEWSFAIGRWNDRAPLSASLNPAPTVWTYAFAMPSDCIAVLQINPDANNRGDDFVMEGGKILTNCGTANIRGIKRVPEPGKYSVWFVNVFAAVLASKVGKKLNASEELRREIWRTRDKELEKAKNADARRAGTPRPIFQDEWNLSRDEDL